MNQGMSSPLLLLVSSAGSHTDAARWAGTARGGFRVETVASLDEAQQRLRVLATEEQLPPLVLLLPEGQRDALLLERLSTDGALFAPLEGIDTVELLSTLAEASGELLRSFDQTYVLACIQDVSRKLVQADAYAIWREDPHKREWTIWSSAGLSDPKASIQVDRDWSGDTDALLSDVVAVEEVQADERLSGRQAFYWREGIRSLLIAPMVLTEGFGTIAFYYRERQRFPAGVLKIARTLSNLASAALKSCALYQEQTWLHGRYRALVDSVPGMVWETDAGFNCTFISRRVEDILGYSPEVWLETPRLWRSRVHPDDMPRLLAEWPQVLAGERTVLEYRLRARDGRIVWVRDLLSVSRDASGEVVGFRGLMLDVSERKHFDQQLQDRLQALRESETRYSLLFDKTPMGLLQLNGEGQVLAVNRRLCEMLDESRDNLLYRRLTDLIHPLDHPLVSQALDPAHWNLELRIRRRQGSYVWVAARANLVQPVGDRPGYLVVGLLDITERRRIEHELVESERRLRIALQAGDMGYFAWDLRTGTVRWNETMARLHGVHETVFEGGVEHYLHYVHASDRERVQQMVEAALRSPQVTHAMAYRVVWAGGEVRWLDSRFQALVDDDGTPGQVTGIVVDATHSKRVETYHTIRHAVSEILSHGDNVRETAPRLLRVTAITLGWDAATLWTLHPPNVGAWDSSGAWTVDDDGNVLQEVGTFSQTGETLVPSRYLHLVQRVSTTGRYIWQAGDDLTWFAFPLMLGRRVLGVMVLRTQGRLSQEEQLVDLGSNLGSLVGQFIARKAIEQQLVQESRIIETLHQAGAHFAAVLDTDRLLRVIVEDAVEILGARWGGMKFAGHPVVAVGTPIEPFIRIFPDSPVFEAVSAGEGPLVFDAGPQLIGAGDLGPRSFLAMPVRARSGEVVGAMCFAQPDAETFHARHERIAMGLSAWAGMALDNAESYQAVQRAERHQRLLARTGALLTATLDTETLAASVASLVASELCDGCVVEILSRQEEESVIAVAHRRNELAQTLRQGYGGLALRARPRDLPGDAHLLPGTVLADVADEDANVLDVRTLLIVPLRARNQALGMLYLVARDPANFSTADLVLAQELAQRSALALDNARLYVREQKLAERLAQSFLGRIPRLESMEIAALYKAAKQAERVGGDYFDFIEFDRNTIGIVLGDVCGKGIEAAAYTAMAKYMLRGYALENPQPAAVLPRLNQALYNEMSDRGMFVTLVYALFDMARHTITYVNAGHPAPLLYNPEDGSCTFLEASAGIVGGMLEMEFVEKTVPFPSGAVLALYTDGVTEAGGLLDRYDDELSATVLRLHDEDARVIVDGLFDYASRKAQGNLRDDVAIVVVRERR